MEKRKNAITIRLNLFVFNQIHSYAVGAGTHHKNHIVHDKKDFLARRQSGFYVGSGLTHFNLQASVSNLSDEETEVKFCFSPKILCCEKTKVYLSVLGGRVRATTQMFCSNKN